MSLMMLLVFSSLLLADGPYGFEYNEYTSHPDILSRIVEAVGLTDSLDGRNKPFLEDGNQVVYLKSASYVGPIETSFGTVHVAQVLYIRSGIKDGKFPPRGHPYLIFLDENFKVRVRWSIDLPLNCYIEGNKLWVPEDKTQEMDKQVVLDYQHLPKAGTLLFESKDLPIPQWERVTPLNK